MTEVIRICEVEVGASQLRDFGLLESGVLRPQQTVGGDDAYPDIHTKAAALMHSLIRNHAFVDGNKRTAVLSVIVFYGLNGHDVITEQGAMSGLAVDIAEGLLNVHRIAEILKEWARPYPEIDVE